MAADLDFLCACASHLNHSICDDDCPCIASVRVEKHSFCVARIITTVRMDGSGVVAGLAAARAALQRRDG